MTDGERAIVIAGGSEDWPDGPRTLTARTPTREPNGTLWFGADLDPTGNQIWFRIAEDAIRRRPDRTPEGRGRRERVGVPVGVVGGPPAETLPSARGSTHRVKIGSPPTQHANGDAFDRHLTALAAPAARSASSLHP